MADVSTNNVLEDCSRLWLGDTNSITQTRLFRHVFQAVLNQKASITLFAGANYHLWINGIYLGRGPAYHHPHRRPTQQFDLTEHLIDKTNVIAVAVHSPGISLHNYMFDAAPGLVAKITIDDLTIITDAKWKVTDQTGWLSDTSRRSWAIGFIEAFDANEAPIGWQQPGYDDSDWPDAQVHDLFAPNTTGIWLDSPLPQLRYQFQPAITMLPLLATTSDVFKLHRNLSEDAIGNHLINETWRESTNIHYTCELDSTTGALTIDGFDGSEAAVLRLDLGQQYTGAVTFDFVSDSAGVIDVGWSELIEHAMPQLLRKGNSYVDRYIARPGDNHWLPLGYSAARYLYLVLRGFTDSVQFKKLGMICSEPNLKWGGSFQCSDEKLNQIWQLCERTIRVGTQEGLIDCATREQAPYVGDGNLIASWIGRLTGDYNHWRYLVSETFAVQNEQGLIKTTVFSGQSHVLLDYELLAVVGARDYMRQTGDMETIAQILPAARRVVNWFIDRMDDAGWLTIDWETLHRQGDFVDAPSSAVDPIKNPGMNIFIDHPGLGWHNREDPGIDRRGKNTALHALLVRTLRALAQMIQACDQHDDQLLSRLADQLATRISETVYRDDQNAYSDGYYDGKLLDQVSQQTNTWCIMAGCNNPKQVRTILQRILRDDDKNLARCGPYFYSYMLPVMIESGMIDESLDQVRQLWGEVLNRGATTMWETFAGDELDSFCHPWSCIPADFLPRHIVGIGSLSEDGCSIELHPQITALSHAQATVMTRTGPVSLGWRDGELFGQLPEGIIGTLYQANGQAAKVQSSWRMTI